MPNKSVSIVVPVFNEAVGLPHFHEALLEACNKHRLPVAQIIYCDDGSTDASPKLIASWHEHDARVVLVRLSRNFGKEQALTAGIAHANGDAIITLDADGQHPIALLPQFIAKWLEGNLVVVGVRRKSRSDHALKRLSSRLFYALYNLTSQQKMIPGITDYCLMDKSVQKAFLQLQEPQRITRALVDWLGFNRVYIPFDAKEREHGNARYSLKKLFTLSTNGLISMSPVPLYIFGAVGMLITACSLVLGLAVLIEQLALNDPLGWNFTGTAQLSILVLFLVGLILMSQGLLSLYISHVHNQTKNRPLYIVDTVHSIGITTHE